LTTLKSRGPSAPPHQLYETLVAPCSPQFGHATPGAAADDEAAAARLALGG
jgi:hypothetical protein